VIKFRPSCFRTYGLILSFDLLVDFPPPQKKKTFSSEPLQALGIVCFHNPHAEPIVRVRLTIRSLLDEVRELPSFLLRNNDDPLVNSIQIFLIFFFFPPVFPRQSKAVIVLVMNVSGRLYITVTFASICVHRSGRGVKHLNRYEQEAQVFHVGQ